jgi:hypothetical protein
VAKAQRVGSDCRSRVGASRDTNGPKTIANGQGVRKGARRRAAAWEKKCSAICPCNRLLSETRTLRLVAFSSCRCVRPAIKVSATRCPRCPNQCAAAGRVAIAWCMKFGCPLEGALCSCDRRKGHRAGDITRMIHHHGDRTCPPCACTTRAPHCSCTRRPTAWLLRSCLD